MILVRITDHICFGAFGNSHHSFSNFRATYFFVGILANKGVVTEFESPAVWSHGVLSEYSYAYCNSCDWTYSQSLSMLHRSKRVKEIRKPEGQVVVKRLHCYSSNLKAALEEFTPDIVVYNAGTDVLDSDPLGLMRISEIVRLYSYMLIFHDFRDYCHWGGKNEYQRLSFRVLVSK